MEKVAQLPDRGVLPLERLVCGSRELERIEPVALVVLGMFVDETPEEVRQQVLRVMLAPTDERASAILAPFRELSTLATVMPPADLPNLIVLAGTAQLPEPEFIRTYLKIT